MEDGGGLDERLTGRHPRVQRGVRVLEHDLDEAAEPAPVADGAGADLPAGWLAGASA
ncbi:hypothetical protein ACFZB9_30680 [Kitasatospora sp. NPDC008050]|uniref:hypothetical protein n=1 Tax=Kitasatospora sp. NPDC008050 TaxID=3364021 RepID=UPI0036E98883